MIIATDFFTMLLNIVLRIALAIAIVFVGHWLTVLSRTRINTVLQRAHLAPSLIVLISTTSIYLIYFATFLVLLLVLGVQLETVLLIATAVFVILGITLQESLRDLAATIKFLLFKPFEKGEFIETGGVLGTVQEIELFNTTLIRGDCKYAVLPNSKIQQDGLLNYSRTGVLRADMEISVGYGEDLRKVKAVLSHLLSEDDRVLKEPEPLIVVLELAENGVEMGVRPFVKDEDYWQVIWDTYESMKIRFDQEGISFAYPQRDVHVKPPSTTQFRQPHVETSDQQAPL